MNISESDPRIGKAVGGFVILVVGLFAFVDALSGNENVIGQLYRVLVLAAPLVGFLAPKPSVYLLLICAGYIDGLKRLLVLDDHLSQLYLFYILGVPSLLLLGILLSILASSVMVRNLSVVDSKILYVGIVLCTFLVAVTALQQLMNDVPFGGVLQRTANGAAYSCLAIVIPILFPTREELLKVLRFLTLIFIPVALYAFKQFFFGYSVGEIIYLQSGLTVVAEQLAYATPRPFSTLASPGVLAATMSVCALASLYPWVLQRGSSLAKRGRGFSLFVFCMYLAASLCTMKRIPAAIAVLGLAYVILFHSHLGTLLTYAAAGIAFVMLVFFPGPVSKLMVYIEDEVAGDQLVMSDYGQMFRTGTFGIRLRSFALFKNPDSYTLFGKAKDDQTSQELESHTLITDLFMNIGIVPLVIFGGLAALILWRVHRRILSSRDREWRGIATLALSIAMALFSGGALGSNAFTVFPANLMFWISIGILVVLFLKDKPRPEPKEGTAVLSAGQPLLGEATPFQGQLATGRLHFRQGA